MVRRLRGVAAAGLVLAASSLVVALAMAQATEDGGSIPMVPAPLPMGGDAPNRPAPGPPALQGAASSPVAVAVARAAEKTGLDPAEIQVLRAEEVTWSDGSLGCPDPDRFYTQALIPGWLVQVQAGDAVLEYHTDTTGRQVILCPASQAIPPLPGPTGDVPSQDSTLGE